MHNARTSPAIHESFRRDDEPAGSSNRTFGLVMAAAFFFLALVPLLRGRAVRWWSLLAGAAFLLSGLLYPRILGPLNRLWLKLGLILHAIVSPVVMGLLFYGTVTPIGVLFRWLGKDPLRLRLDQNAATYWIERRPPGPAPHTMPRQF
jgi:predicted membrane metal-binding protein